MLNHASWLFEQPNFRRWKGNGQGMSLRTRMILLFVLMLFGTVGALGAFIFSGWMGEVRRAVNQTAEWTAADVADVASSSAAGCGA